MGRIKASVVAMLVPFRSDWEAFPCIEFIGFCDRDGYGKIQYRGQKWFNHRLEWTLKRGPIPVGYICMHACDNPPCYAIEHLGIGTHKNNADDMDSKGRRVPGRLIGSEHNNTKLTEAQVFDIKTMLALPSEERTSAYRLAKIYGVGITTIFRIRDGETWTHVKIVSEAFLMRTPEQKKAVYKKAGLEKRKLTVDDIVAIKKLLAIPKAERLSQAKIAAMYGVSASIISNINCGKDWGTLEGLV